MEFIEVCSMQDIQPGTSRAARLGTTDVVLFNVAGTVHALENSCLHSGAALSGGRLCGKVVACPAHGWRYDVTTGALLVAPGKAIKTFPVRVTDEKIAVQVER